MSMDQTQGRPKFLKEAQLKLKSHIDAHTLIVGSFSMPFSPTGSSSRQKQSGEMLELSDLISQMDLLGIYRAFHLDSEEHNFFSAARGLITHSDLGYFYLMFCFALFCF